MTNPLPHWLADTTTVPLPSGLTRRRKIRAITSLHRLSDHQLKDIGLRRELGGIFAW